ncbi:MAG: TIGR01244 family sulfur transferase [Pseudomonadota bacterium]
MSISEITPDYSVAPQITTADVKLIADRGFKSIMCNRPDGEDRGQTPVEEIRAEAERVGLTFAFVPVISGHIQPENVQDFAAALDALPTPVLAYCRSGGRCQQLWMMAKSAT